MDYKQARKEIITILEQKIKFEGHFNKCFNNLKETQQKEIIEWVKNCKEKKADPIQSKTQKEIIGFIKRIGSNIRAILTKKKEKYFLTLFLDKHKYYEEEIEKIGF